MQLWQAIVSTGVYYLTRMTSSGGRDPVFQNPQLWAYWELSINNSSKTCCGGTYLNYLFFQFQIFGSKCLSLAWFPRGSYLPEPPREDGSTALWLSLPLIRAQAGTPDQAKMWLLSECIQGACWVWKGTKSSRPQWVQKGGKEKCFGSTHLHSCQMAKLGLPLLSPAAGLRAVLSLTPETKCA